MKSLFPDYEYDPPRVPSALTARERAAQFGTAALSLPELWVVLLGPSPRSAGLSELTLADLATATPAVLRQRFGLTERETLILLLEKKFGELDERIRQKVDRIRSAKKLESLLLGVLEAETVDELGL